MLLALALEVARQHLAVFKHDRQKWEAADKASAENSVVASEGLGREEPEVVMVRAKA